MFDAVPGHAAKGRVFFMPLHHLLPRLATLCYRVDFTASYRAIRGLICQYQEYEN